MVQRRNLWIRNDHWGRPSQHRVSSLIPSRVGETQPLIDLHLDLRDLLLKVHDGLQSLLKHLQFLSKILDPFLLN